MAPEENVNCPKINNKIKEKLFRTITMQLPFLVFGAKFTIE
jgi:hypothetical protein